MGHYFYNHHHSARAQGLSYKKRQKECEGWRMETGVANGDYLVIPQRYHSCEPLVAVVISIRPLFKIKSTNLSV